MKTASEKVWAEVFGVEIPADETLKNEKGTTPVIGIPEVLDDNGYNIEGVCVMDFSGLRDMYNTSECFHTGSVNC